MRLELRPQVSVQSRRVDDRMRTQILNQCAKHIATWLGHCDVKIQVNDNRLGNHMCQGNGSSYTRGKPDTYVEFGPLDAGGEG